MSQFFSKFHILHKTRSQSGFSLLELVVAVSIMLILAVVGFITYQGLTDNARQATVDNASNEVMTAVIAAANVPNGDPVAEVERYNDTADGVFTNITTASATSLTVQAEMCDGTTGVAKAAGNYITVDTTDFGNITYEWLGEPGLSPSVKYGCDGEVVATNLSQNPGFEKSLENYGTIESGAADVSRTTEWSVGGNYGIEHYSTYEPGRTSSYINVANFRDPRGLERGKTYTIYTEMKKNHDANDGQIRTIRAGGTGATSPHGNGEYRLRAVFTVPLESESETWYVRLYHNGVLGDPPIWWDNVMVLEGDVEMAYFDGDGAG